jgi:hypothetical protein
MSYSDIAVHSTCPLSASQTFLENVTCFCWPCAAAVQINSAVNVKTETQLWRGVFVENLHIYPLTSKSACSVYQKILFFALILLVGVNYMKL